MATNTVTINRAPVLTLWGAGPKASDYRNGAVTITTSRYSGGGLLSDSAAAMLAATCLAKTSEPCGVK